MPQTTRRLIQIGPLPPGLQSLASERYALEPLWTQPGRVAFLSANAGRFDGAVTMSRHARKRMS